MAADRRWHKVRCRVHPGYKQTDNHKLAQLQDWQSVKSLKGGEHQKKKEIKEIKQWVSSHNCAHFY